MFGISAKYLHIPANMPNLVEMILTNPIMKNIFRIFLAFALSVAFVSNAHAQNPETSEGRIIIAVNTDWGVGYFTDANGKLLFKKQFEEVDAFIGGLAKAKKPTSKSAQRNTWSTASPASHPQSKPNRTSQIAS